MTLQNVTVIIPAHNRPKRLRRLLDYYSRTDIKVLVPDSSDHPFADAEKYPDITYLHRPKLHFLLKLKEVLPMISTPYVLYCADDDFAVPSGIAQMTAFLDEHPDYSTAQGHYLTFTPRKGKISFYPRYIRYFDKQVTGETPRERLLQEKNMYASLLYSVIRTRAFQRMYAACFNPDGSLRFRNLFLAEEFFNHAALIFGKYATLPYFYSAREHITGSAAETTVPVSVIKTSHKYREEYQGFLLALSELLAAREGDTLEDAFSFICSISDMPKDTAEISGKRKIMEFTHKHPLLRWVNRLANWRYNQKGLKAVRGMQSYPCTFSTPEKEEIINKLTIATIKYTDLLPYRKTDYIFDPVKFSSIDGKTGPYILYTIVRIKSILNKVDIDSKMTNICNDEMRNVLVKMTEISNALTNAYNERTLNYIAEMLYDICSLFNKFYNNCNIVNEQNMDNKASYVAFIKIVYNYIKNLLNILAIDEVEKM